MDREAVVVTSVPDGRLTQRIEAGPHVLFADEPPEAGDDRGPTPYELLLAALGACTSMTLRMYADAKKLPLASVSVRLTYERTHVKDCEEDVEGKIRRVHRIEREIHLNGDLSDEQRARLIEIADRCPVSRSLTEEKEIVTRLV
jgi:putative redox protein